jgi:pimeloyl-ACP methyl ester carboxylesterase
VAQIQAVNGSFPGNIPYAKVGHGTKNIVCLVGGPGNDVPRGMELSMYIAGFKSFTDEYSIWVTSRKQGQPDNYGTREMAADTARAIQETFPGGLDAIVGISYGGFVAQYLAADFPELVPKYLLVSTASRGSREVCELDMRFAELLVAGKNGRAFFSVAGYLYPPGIKRSTMRLLMFVLGGLTREHHHPDFKSDVINEARMELEHDSAAVLSRITDSVLMIGGDRDLAFPRELQEETAAAIPGARLILYEGRAHGDVTADKRFAHDVRNFFQPG